MKSPAVDTIVAVATPPGRGAVGVLRLSGPACFEIAARMAGPLPAPRMAVLRRFRDAQDDTIDRGLLLCFAGPQSYTGEDVAELQAHGGPVVMDQLLRAAVAMGARQARPGEFSERAFLNGRLDLAQAEAVADLIDASTTAAARAAQRSLDGALSHQVQALTEELMSLRVYVEGALDFSDEDIDWLGDGRLHQRVAQAVQHTQALLRACAQGRRVRDGLVATLTGRPNVGKSTLLNALAGADVAIVTPVAGTTRDPLREHLDIDGLAVTLVDTAGLRDSDDLVEREGIRRARLALEQAELALFLIDDPEGFTDADIEQLRQLPAGLPVLCLHNKCDLSDQLPERFERDGMVHLRLSAATGMGLDLLRDEILRFGGVLERGESLFSARTRHVASLEKTDECLRRAEVLLLQQKLPELAAEELRLAADALGEITGRVSSEDLLGEIFSRFCIGK